jgi:hypothetical protein
MLRRSSATRSRLRLRRGSALIRKHERFGNAVLSSPAKSTGLGKE